jgi:hypothetical protein
MNLLSFVVQIKIEKYNENKNFISWINTDSLFSFTRVLTQMLFITKNSFCLLLLLLLHFTHQKNNNPSLHNFTAYLYEHQAFIYIIPYVIWVYKPHSYLLNPSTLTFHIINFTHSHLPNNIHIDIIAYVSHIESRVWDKFYIYPQLFYFNYECVPCSC